MKKHRSTALIIAALAALGPFSIDTYFPSFPALATHFGVSEIRVQSTLSYYLAALAGMNLFHGAISDSYGRRRVILVSLAIYTATAVACVFAPNFLWLLGLRVVQGLAAGAGMIVGRAVIRDLFDGSHSQKLMAQTAMVGGLGPVIAPILGGWLHVWMGWRGPFLFLALLGAAFWLGCFLALPESLPVERRQPFHPGHLLRGYEETCFHPEFVLLCLALSLGGGGFLLYVATAPDVVLNILKLSPTQFGWLYLPLVSGMIAGSALSSKAAGRIAPARLVRYSFVSMALGAAVNVAVQLWSAPPVLCAVLPLTLYTFGFSLMAPVITIKSLDLFPNRRGLASSMQGFAMVVVFALISSFAAPFVYRSGLKHAIGLASMMTLSWLAYATSQWYASNPQRGSR